MRRATTTTTDTVPSAASSLTRMSRHQTATHQATNPATKAVTTAIVSSGQCTRSFTVTYGMPFLRLRSVVAIAQPAVQQASLPAKQQARQRVKGVGGRHRGPCRTTRRVIVETRPVRSHFISRLLLGVRRAAPSAPSMLQNLVQVRLHTLILVSLN